MRRLVHEAVVDAPSAYWTAVAWTVVNLTPSVLRSSPNTIRYASGASSCQSSTHSAPPGIGTSGMGGAVWSPSRVVITDPYCAKLPRDATPRTPAVQHQPSRFTST